MTSRTGNHASADVLIEGDRITEIGQRLRAPKGTEIIEAADTVVMPGFVDAHRHLWESIFCNLGDRAALADTASAAAIYGPHYTAEDVYAATLLGLLGAADTGITTVVDIFDGPPEYIDAAIGAHRDAGLRTVLVPASPSWNTGHDQSELLRRYAGAGASMMTIAAGSTDPTASNHDAIAREWALARELGLRIHAHAGRDPMGQGTITAIAELLGEDVTLVHVTHTSEADLDTISATGALVVLTPSSEMAGGLGTPPLQALIDRNIQPGLGVDGERVSPGDMFAQMRAVISLQHASYFDLKLAGKGGLPRLLTTRQVLRYATSEGARVAGLASVTGTLEVGKQADIVMLRTDRPNIAPINDPIGAVVWGMDTSNVDNVFVAGVPVKRDGVLLADAGRAMQLATTAQKRIGGAAGLLSGAST